jgi:hypothetical protein
LYPTKKFEEKTRNNITICPTKAVPPKDKEIIP